MSSPLRRVAALALALCALAPSPADAQAPRDPIQALAGRSPLCAGTLAADQRRACRQAGSVEHAYPISHYALDTHINTGPTRPQNTLAAAVQWIVALLWTALVYLLKALLLLMQWAFSLDLLGHAMAPARRALDRLHNDTLGTTWLSAALVLLGAWATWRGVVQRRVAQTASGLAVAVAMMAGALAVIQRPADTVGALSHGANEVSLGLLAGASTGSVRHPARTLAQANRQIFDTIVLRPWCALQFGDVAWCLRAAPATGNRAPADRWLRHEPESRQREAEYAVLAGDSLPGKHTFLGIDPLAADTDGDVERQTEGVRKNPLAVKLQTKSLTAARVGLLVVVALGTAGCLAVVGWLTFKVVVQGVLTLVLLLGAPVMLLAPAFGERGRDLFAAWAKRLLAAALAKAIYALFLGIVLTIGGVVGELDGQLPWFVAWLISAVYWWGIFTQRAALMGWLSFGHQGRDSGGLLRLHLANQALTPAIAAATGGASAAALGVAAVARGAGTRTREAKRARAHDDEQAVHHAARDQLQQRARERLEDRYQQAQTQLVAHDDAREKLAGVRRRLAELDRNLERAKRSKRPEDRDRADELQRARPALIAQRNALEGRLLARAKETAARRFVESADRTQLEQGRRFTDTQLDAQLHELRDDLAAGAGPEDPRHRWRARRLAGGLPDSELAKLSERGRAELHATVAEDLQRDRALLRALPHDQRPLVSRAQKRAARRALDARDLARHRRLVRETRAAQAAQDDPQDHRARAVHRKP